jgi:phosphate/sulfate permease
VGNFIAFLVFGAHVAQTVGTGIVSADVIDPRVVFGALIGAITWITWGFGIPSSSSHALIGGLVGAGTAKGDWAGNSALRDIIVAGHGSCFGRLRGDCLTTVGAASTVSRARLCQI